MQAGACCLTLLVGQAAPAEEEVDYAKSLKPILRERCYACHGALKQEASLRLDTVSSMLEGGDSGPAVDVKEVDVSPLLERISSKDDAIRMPPEGEHLTEEQVALFRAWVAQGAKGPSEEKPEQDPRDHWAFKTPVKSAIPQVQDPVWGLNPIDAFIEASREPHQLPHQPPADPRILLRRIYLDLIGLPPTSAELEAFASDPSPQAYEAIVDRLLQSPQYGERWGRHWMDVWRYSDWWGLGNEVRNSQRHIWHWRDWIIESMNSDKPYDQMLREMLAADELYPNDFDKLRASGYLARHYFKFNRTTWLDGTVEHTAKAMLGLTFNCAKCHDHKYDPVTQVDYYKLRAIFEPYQVRTDQLPGEGDIEKGGLPRAFDCHLDAPTFLHIRGDDRNPDKSARIEPGVPEALDSVPFTVAAVELPVEAYRPGVRPFVLENVLNITNDKIAAAKKARDEARQKLSEAEAAMNLAAVEKKTEPASFELIDDFQAARPDVWEPVSGNWIYAEGKLRQISDNTGISNYKLKSQPPRDFEAKLLFTTTGGQMWKSVGLSFDEVEQNNAFVYLSAVSGGSKSQVAYKVSGSETYPGEGAQSRKVEVGQPLTMTLRVRGNLVNLLVNEELSVAYRLPVERRTGALQLMTYDAQAEFSRFELKTLSAETVLQEAAGKSESPEAGPQRLKLAQISLALADKAVAALESEVPAIQARYAAQRAMSELSAEESTVKAREAVKLERVTALLRAEQAVLQAELDLVKAVPEKKTELETKLAAAKSAVEAARSVIETPAENFSPLRGSEKTMESSVETEEQRQQPFPKTSSGRRTALAQWITDPKNPLTARVAVNHLWMRHMGKPLVPTVFDFGRKGTPPTHPELLDWLAVELIESGWSMKKLHRLIVTSQTYRMSSSSLGVTPETLAMDPENKYYWRMNPMRMEAQVIRDSLLAIAGELDPAMGGPSIPVTDENSRRRSLYFAHSHNDHHPFLSMFDDASVLDCYRREESVLPQQALALENSQLASAMAEKIVRQITATKPQMDDAEFSRTAFITILAWEPSSEELELAQQAFGKLSELARVGNHADPVMRARINLVQSFLNHNDFVTVR